MSMRLPLLVLLAICLTTVCISPAGPSSAVAADPETAFFENKIRPVLIEHCYECHSADSPVLKGGLAVDHREGLLAGGDSGPALEPGNIEDSLLISSMKYESFEMPPAGRLPDHVIRDFEQWVSNGAVDPREAPAGSQKRRQIDWEAARQSWAYQPLEPAKSKQDTSAWAAEIDGKIDARLAAVDVTPNAPADAEKRLRRLHYDLTGLPPTPQEILEFVDDPSPERWHATVERLLASPRFGERWGRHWLDVARYADSNGGDFNATYYNAWRYRDYVIQAMNEDKPVNEFFREQVAGDLMESADQQQAHDRLVATGFLMIGPKMLSERDKEKLTFDVIDEQIDTFGKAFLGLSLGCARCHDHKFDPIPTADYYAMAGIFHGTQVLDGESQQYVSDWLRRELPTSEQHRAELREHQQQLAELKSRKDKLSKQVKIASEQVKRLQMNQGAITIDNVDAKLIGDWTSSTFASPYIGKDYIHDNKQGKGERSVVFNATLPEAGRYQVLFAFNGSGGRDKAVPVHVDYDGERSSTTVDQSVPPKIYGQFADLGTFEYPAGAEVSVTISNTGTTGYVIVDAVQFLRVDSTEKRPEEDAELAAATKQLKQLEDQLKEIGKAEKKLKADSPPPMPQAMAVQDRPTCENCPIMIRGEHTNPGDIVPRGTLQIISGDSAELDIMSGSGRLELADWLVDDAAPLASRVYVNRVWLHLLGQGLVRTVNDFGGQGTPPTHPELLDAMAAQFQKQNWSTKALIRAIVHSQVYQRSSVHQADGFAKDPENLLWWRGHRRPLSAEELRDSLLVLQEQLEQKAGGSSVSHLGRLAVNNSNQSGAAKDDSYALRRTVYLPVLRNQLDEIRMLFDFANPEMVVGKRPATNVPAQSLYLMNHPQTRETATELVERAFTEHGEGSFSCLPELYLKLFGRLPSQNDDQLIQDYLNARINDEGNSEQVKTAWVDMVQALLISTEFRYVD